MADTTELDALLGRWYDVRTFTNLTVNNMTRTQWIDYQRVEVLIATTDPPRAIEEVRNAIRRIIRFHRPRPIATQWTHHLPPPTPTTTA